MRPLLIICATALLLLPSGASAGQGLDLRMRDRCEPFSFNAAIGEEICEGDGNVTFDEFIAELQEKQEHGAWSFKPRKAKVHEGRDITVENQGGELHTFTAVAEFGGGFVPDLNELSGTPVPVPECDGAPDAADLFLGAGRSAPFEPALGRGSHRFQCCIHPWMRSTLTVR